MYPNVNLKKAIERFLDEHPWAYDEVAAWHNDIINYDIV